MNQLPTLNDLVRVAMDAQEAFDNWNEGRTWDRVLRAPIYCSLDDITQACDEANTNLVRFILEHGEQLLVELKGERI